MNRGYGRVIGVLVGVACGLMPMITLAADAPMQSSIPSAELDEHYLGVPKLESYTYAMLELGIRMGAATAAAMDDSGGEAGAAIASFKKQFELVRSMVPSWRKHFDLGSIDTLDRAVTEGSNKATLRRLVSSIEDACTACHVQYMIPVQARYRWGTFSDISIESEAGKDVDFHTIMLDLSNGLGALRGHVESGNIEAATAHYQLVMGRFTMMELACTACHEDPREYFIDSRVKGHLFRISGLLRKASTDTAAYTAELNAINEASCLPCHQVHMPAAFLQRYWELGE